MHPPPPDDIIGRRLRCAPDQYVTQAASRNVVTDNLAMYQIHRHCCIHPVMRRLRVTGIGRDKSVLRVTRVTVVSMSRADNSIAWTHITPLLHDAADRMARCPILIRVFIGFD